MSSACDAGIRDVRVLSAEHFNDFCYLPQADILPISFTVQPFDESVAELESEWKTFQLEHSAPRPTAMTSSHAPTGRISNSMQIQ